MTNNIVVGYSPNDFFYVNAINNNTMPSDDECALLNPYDQSWESKCNNTNFNDNNEDCTNQALCINKDKAIALTNLGNNGTAATEKYMNEKMNYDNTLMNTINLGIGIGFLLFIIYKNQK
jgi:hypothetical protein